MSDPLLGARVRDSQSGYEGIATARIDFHTGCSHYVVEATTLKEDGTLVSFYEFDPQRLSVVEGAGKVEVAEPTAKLWADVKDRITGFSGFVSATKASLFGSPQICIEPNNVRPDGELNQPEWFFEERVDVKQTQELEAPLVAPVLAERNYAARRAEQDDSWEAPFGRDRDGDPVAPFGFMPDGRVKVPRLFQATADPVAPFGYWPSGKPYAPHGYNWKDGSIKLAPGGPSPYGSGIGGVR